MLTEFFHMYATDKKLKKYLYKEFPEHFVWNKKDKYWSERKKGKAIGRISAANPSEGERYYERILLNHIKGPPSFQYLLTVKGTAYLAFKESAQKRGLLEADKSVIECLNEAITFQMPTELRRLFAIILVHCVPTDVNILWNMYFDAMSEDFKKETHTTLELQISKTLKSLSAYLESMGKDINNYDLPKIPMNFGIVDGDFPREIQDEMSVQIPEEDQQAELKLNAEQKIAFSMILECVEKGDGGIFFIDGPGGTGKTFLYKALLAKVRLRNLIALATATSGVAAGIMPGGRTAHADEGSDCSVSKQSALAEFLRMAKLIIWDEAPMAKKWAIENVDKLLMQDVMGNAKNFGGKVMVFGGDFRQVLPVVPKATVYQTISASLVKSIYGTK